MSHRCRSGIVAVGLCWMMIGAAAAAPLRLVDVPSPLKPWVPWVLRGHETALCPTLGDDESAQAACAWSGNLTLTLDARGGRFSQDWQVLAPTFVPLPGDGTRWPLDVKAGGKSVAVVEQDGVPAVELAVGRFVLTGVFQWRSLPESLPVPDATGIIALTVAGKRIVLPSRSEDGELFLHQAAAPAETDSLQIAVHRKLTDGVPLLLVTRLSLEVAGKAREVVLGRSLPEGFAPHALASPLPARIESDGRIRVQVRPGSWVLTLTARQLGDGPAKAITRPAPDGPWKEGEEVWVFEAAPAVRVATVEGVPSVDPQQTTLPPEWRSLPAYILAPGTTLALSEHRRGDTDPEPDQLRLDRRLWLDFDGGGFTAQDRISGSFRRSWRLSMGPAEKLGRVAVGTTEQFITRLPGGGEGVEIRQGQAHITAESRIEGPVRALPVAGWDHDFQAVAATLEVPPGWRLLHVSGADAAAPTWVRQWSLLQLFLVLVSALAVGKLFGPRAGALALAALGVSVTESGAPEWLWLAVLLGEALVRVLGERRLGQVVRVYRLGAWIALLLCAVPFAVEDVRAGLFPAQEQHRGSSYGDISRAGLLGAAAPEEVSPPPVAVAEMMQEEDKRKAGPQETVEAPRVEMQQRLVKAAPAAVAVARHASSSQQAQNLSTYDPTVMVQTGPGVPTWSWRTVNLVWTGPVERGQQLSLWLLPPWLNAVLAFARVGLIALLMLLLLRGSRGTLARFLGEARATAVLVLVLALASPVHAAEFPPETLLDHLRAGLVEKPACAPECATLGRLDLEATPDRLRLRIEVSAVGATAVALPGQAKHWAPAEVLLDGKLGPHTRRGEDGTLWLVVSAGSHQVILDGPLPDRETVQLPLPTKPHVVTATARGWKLDGVGDEGEIADTLQLTRQQRAGTDGVAKPGGSAALASSSLPPFVTVERTLRLGLKWQVETHVTRTTPAGTAVLIEVPLLAGESPLTEGVRVVQGKAQVTMAADDAEFSWTSSLAQQPSLVLAAARALAFTEIWHLDLGPIWHAEIGGIPPVHPGNATGARVPQWRPWPGEKVTLAVSRPGGSEGRTLTIESASLSLRPGARSTAATLQVDLRASRGGLHVITLPAGAKLEALAVGGAAQPLREDGRRVTIPLRPGQQNLSLAYRVPTGLGALFRAPVPDLGAPAVNVKIDVHMAEDRWILLTGGPRLGPSVLFWSTLVVLVLVALALGRSPLTPLRARHWVLLGLGLSQIPVPAAAGVAGYFLVMGLRRRRIDARNWLFDLRQLVLVVWTVIVVVILFIAVEQGLLSKPDMHIAGNGSGREFLSWFVDRTAAAPPVPWVLSAPILVYRIAMLAWALWLAAAVIRWSRWAWGCFAEGGLWRPLRKQKAQSGAGVTT